MNKCKLCEDPIYVGLDEYVQLSDDSLICWDCTTTIKKLLIEMKEVLPYVPEELDEPQPEEVD